NLHFSRESAGRNDIRERFFNSTNEEILFIGRYADIVVNRRAADFYFISSGIHYQLSSGIEFKLLLLEGIFNHILIGRPWRSFTVIFLYGWPTRHQAGFRRFISRFGYGKI